MKSELQATEIVKQHYTEARIMLADVEDDLRVAKERRDLLKQTIDELVRLGYLPDRDWEAPDGQ